jgi:hypothetical protein
LARQERFLVIGVLRQRLVLTIVFDAAPLITAYKFEAQGKLVIDHLRQLYAQFEGGEISLGYFAHELGMGVRDLYAALEQRGLTTTNIGAPPPVTSGSGDKHVSVNLSETYTKT